MSVSGAEPERAAELASWAMNKGLKALKVKVGIEPEGDIRVSKQCARQLGPTSEWAWTRMAGGASRVAIATIRRMADE